MKALCLQSSSPPSLAVVSDAVQPTPSAGELLIRVRAAGVTPTEIGWYPTTHAQDGTPRSNQILSHEFSGVVAELGSAVRGFGVGQEVFGVNDWFTNGATAEFCITTPDRIAPKPARLSHEEAATVPISALTVWQGLFDRAQLRAGERILIHGGAGGVGLFAIQLAVRHGAHVVTTVSSRNFEFVRQLGAEQIIDYHAESFEEKAGQVDVVLDTVGGETLKRSWDLLKPGGRMITIVGDGADVDERSKKAFFIVEPNQKQLMEIGDLLNLGQLRTVVDAAVTLDQAADAYTGRISKRLGHGKMVVVLAVT